MLVCLLDLTEGEKLDEPELEYPEPCEPEEFVSGEPEESASDPFNVLEPGETDDTGEPVGEGVMVMEFEDPLTNEMEEETAMLRSPLSEPCTAH